MPIFEYRCEGCGEKFECLVRGDEKVSCPACDKSRLKKLFSTFASKSGDRFMSSTDSSCGTCSASSCAGCRG